VAPLQIAAEPLPRRGRVDLAGPLRLLAGAVLLAVLFLALALALSRQPPPLALVLAAGVSLLAILALALTRYDMAVALGVLLLAVVRVEPAPPDLVFAVVIAVAAVTSRFHLRRVPLSVTVLISLFLALNMIAALELIDVARALMFFAITLYLGVFALWLAGYVRSADRAQRVAGVYLAAAVVSALFSALALYVQFPGSSLLVIGPRAKGLFKDPNVFGPFLVVVALIVLAEILEPRLLTGRLLTKLGILLSLSLGIVFAYSRAAWLNAAVGVFVMLCVYALRRQGGVKVAKIVAALAVAFAVVSVTLTTTGSADFLQERAQLQSYDTERFAGWRAGIDLSQQYPLGIGPGQFEQTVGIASHSLYVRLLAEQGIFGLVVLAGLLFGTLGFAAANAARGRDSYGISSAALLAAWCGVVVNSAFVDTLHWRHFWLVAALIWVGAMRHDAMSRPASWDSLRAGAR
jgi:O-antigen ligase